MKKNFYIVGKISTMTKRVLFALFILTGFSVQAQDISGSWYGVLSIQGSELRLVLNIKKQEATLSATLDSPDQGAKDIPVDRIQYDKYQLEFEVKAGGISYTAAYDDGKFVGNFRQGGRTFPLNLSREAIEKKVSVRSQEPKAPFPYYTEEVTFTNEVANVSLAGTLSLPKKEGKFPAVILISGSGPQNRDEELLGHKPFLVLADYLTRNGIAVLRYDDRGVAKSTGDFDKATSFDFASDVNFAVNYLQSRKEINSAQLGLVGHSEGGLIAPIVASKRKKDVAFIVLLAGTGIQGADLLLQQQELIGRASGVPEADLQKSKELNKGLFDLVLNELDSAKLFAASDAYMRKLLKDIPPSERPQGLTEDQFVNTQLDQVLNPWMMNFLRFNPQSVLIDVQCPVLALNGELDLQVPAEVNLNGIREALKKGGNKKLTTQVFPKLNHLFQHSTTGSPDEYSQIEETISPEVLSTIATWIKTQLN